MDRSIWIGYDPREVSAFAVARNSIKRRLTVPIPIRGLILDDLMSRGLYTRDTRVNKFLDGRNEDGSVRIGHRLWDVISEHPMATEFAISRFLVPHLVREHTWHGKNSRWAVFMDCDMMARTNLDLLFSQADDRYAVMVVKHDFNPSAKTKMDGQVQSKYARKNWSSVMLFNVDHPANAALTPNLVNGLPGRDLHRFCWLDDDEIGELHYRWNYLVGFHKPVEGVEPAIVHFTDGIPTMVGYEDCEYADEWRDEIERWAT